MQRGGSEAISAGKPLITSDTQTLRAIFTAGTVHVAPRAPAIRAGIQELRRNYDAYARGIRDLATRREERWLRAREELEALLSGRRETAKGARGSRPRRGPDDGP